MLDQGAGRTEAIGIDQMPSSDLFDKLLSCKEGLVLVRNECQEPLAAMAMNLRVNKTCKVGQTAKARFNSTPYVTVFAVVRTMATTMASRGKNPDVTLRKVAPHMRHAWIESLRTEKDKKNAGRAIRDWIHSAPDEVVGEYFATLLVESAFLEPQPAPAN